MAKKQRRRQRDRNTETDMNDDNERKIKKRKLSEQQPFSFQANATFTNSKRSQQTANPDYREMNLNINSNDRNRNINNSNNIINSNNIDYDEDLDLDTNTNTNRFQFDTDRVSSESSTESSTNSSTYSSTDSSSDPITCSKSLMSAQNKLISENKKNEIAFKNKSEEKEKMFDPVMERYTISGRRNNIITKTGAVGWNLAFGKQVIPSNNNCVYKWKVKRVTAGNQELDIILGFDGNKQHFYQYYSSGALSINGKSMPDGEGKGKSSNITFKKRGDIMTFILNFATSTITICKNDGEGNGAMTDIVFENIKKGQNIKYRFVVMMYGASESLHFLEIPDVNEVNNEVNNDGKQQNDKQQVHAAEVKGEKHKKKHKHSKKSKRKNERKSKTKVNNEVNDENESTNTNNRENGNGNGFDRPLEEYKVNELKKFLKERSLKTSGLKKELVARLIEAVKKENDKNKKKKKDKKNLKRNIEKKREKNEENVSNASKIKKQRRNHNSNDDIKHDGDIRRMAVEEVRKLKKGDLIDHQYRDGKYMAAKVINSVRGSDLRMEYIYNNDTIWCDYTEQYQLKRFAKYKSISSRPPHLLSNLQLGEEIYLNLKMLLEHKREYAKLGWIKCAIKEKDNGQIKAQFVWQNKEISYWVHLDESNLVSDNQQWVQNQTTRYIPESIKRQLAFDQNHECKCGCNNPLLPTYEIDHIRPVYKGGTNDRNNLQALNPQCHRNKTNKDNWN